METYVSDMQNINWDALLDELRPDRPDAYHFAYKAGAVKHPVEFGKFHGPAGNETLWETYDAHSRLHANPSDKYASDTLVMGIVRGIQEIAGKYLDQRNGRSREMYSKDGPDTVGADLFTEGLLAAIEVIKSRREFTECGEDDPDELEQLKKFIFAAARNRMVGHFRSMYPKWWCSAVGLPEDDEHADGENNVSSNNNRRVQSALVEKRSNEQSDEAADLRAKAAIEAACRDDTDKQIVALRELDYSQKEIAEVVGLSRDQVQRALKRIYKRVQELLDLPHAKLEKRC